MFIDCDYCDIEYIKTEITFVNYVREKESLATDQLPRRLFAA